MKPFLSRRTVLRGMLGAGFVSVALPPLEAMMNATGTAYAGGTRFPKRFGVWFWGNGVLPERWVPTTEGAGWTPSPQLMPLMPLRDQVTVVSGTRVMTTNDSPHGSGPAGLLSGDNARGGSFLRPSLDQLIAQEVGGATRFRSLEVGVQRSTSSLSYTGPNQVNPPETSPRALFNRLFGEGFRLPGEMATADPRLALRRSVLDAVSGQAGRLRGRLGAADRQRLEQHLDGVRGLEQRIGRLEADPPNLAACARPMAPPEAFPDMEGRPQTRAISRAVSDLLVMALACDQTRVFFNMFSQPVNNTLYGRATAGHHQLTHDEPGDQPQVHTILVSIHEELAYFLSALRAVREGDGTLLDHLLVLATTDCSFGRTHAIDNYPILLCGGCNGAVRAGVHYRSTSGENASRVSLAILRAMEVRATDFGVGPGRVTDPLGAVLR
ncbi:MAG: DUF1552 domain-containing protein [Deltaproteobacteria bacterium]|nr:DUF1552 domain-containing protein [Deltaproteobacteria bacterium]